MERRRLTLHIKRVKQNKYQAIARRMLTLHIKADLMITRVVNSSHAMERRRLTLDIKRVKREGESSQKARGERREERER
jgi:hypothetical protein